MAGITLKQTLRTAERAVAANFCRRHDPRYGDLYRQSTRDAITLLRSLRPKIEPYL